MMVLAPSTFLLAIPFQHATTKLTVVKLKHENYKQKSNEQHGLRFHHLLVFFFWYMGCILCLGDGGIEGQL